MPPFPPFPVPANHVGAVMELLGARRGICDRMDKHGNLTHLEFIADDESVEVTPDAVRLRRRLLSENERERRSRDKTR